jgi:hypothetical protein
MKTTLSHPARRPVATARSRTHLAPHESCSSGEIKKLSIRRQECHDFYHQQQQQQIVEDFTMPDDDDDDVTTLLFQSDDGRW